MRWSERIYYDRDRQQAIRKTSLFWKTYAALFAASFSKSGWARQVHGLAAGAGSAEASMASAGGCPRPPPPLTA